MDNPFERVPLLNHGGISLVNFMGNEQSIVNAARVSYASQAKTGTDPIADTKLLNYLLKHKHMTPFESAVLTFNIECPLVVARQWHRHRTQGYNEVSARYTELPDKYYIPEISQIFKQSTGAGSSKQMSAAELVESPEAVQKEIDIACASSFVSYKTLLAAGVSRELARIVLPTATYTQFLATASLRNWLQFLELRLHKHAQYEIRVYAEVIESKIQELFPNLKLEFDRG